MTASKIELLYELSPAERDELLADLNDADIERILVDWSWIGRPEQLVPPGLWRWWLLMTGRGFGKTRTGAEFVCGRCEFFARHGHDHLVLLMNSTLEEARALQLNGVSGLNRVAARRGHRVDVPKSGTEGRLRVWRPGEGWHDSTVELHTAAEPERARGRNAHTAWMEELAKWQHRVDAEGGSAFTNADFSLRAPCPKGERPRGVITTTPKPISLIIDLAKKRYDPDTVVTSGKLADNHRNLDPSFVAAMEYRYRGSRLGAQELDGVLLDVVEGALWTPGRLQATRVPVDENLSQLPRMFRIVVAIDPAGSDKPEADETGIVVAGVARILGVTHLYVLEDLSGHFTSTEWPEIAVAAYYRWNADAIVGETNYGGDMVRGVIVAVDGKVPVDVVTATRGKAVRAEPVSVLWSPQQRRGHLVGYHPELETQLTTWVPGESDDSPDRLDAMVWAGSALLPEIGRREAVVQSPTGSTLGDATPRDAREERDVSALLGRPLLGGDGPLPGMGPR